MDNQVYNIIYLSNYPWSNMFSRYTNLALALSKSRYVYKLVFLEPLVHIGDCIRSKDFINKINFIGCYKSLKNTPIDVRSVISPIPFIRYVFFNNCYNLWEKITFKTIQDIIPVHNRILIVQGPSDYGLSMLKEFNKKGFISVFDWADLYEKHAGPDLEQKRVAKLCRELASNAHFVLGISPRVTEIAASVNKRSYTHSDAVLLDLVVQDIKPPKPIDQRIKNPQIAYFGLMNRYKLDNQLIYGVVESKPEWDFIFIGSHQDNDLIEKVAGLKNIKFVSPMDGHSLHKFLINNIDLCFFPYNPRDEANKACSPMKLYETLGLGLPIVSIDSFDPLDAKNLISVGSSISELIYSIEQELLNDTIEKREERVRYAKNSTWEIRAEQLIEIIQSTTFGIAR
jgi:hypothetical protein